MMNAIPSDADRVVFDRRELNLILSTYGRFVAAGEWRDYGMSFLRIEKRPRLRAAQGAYAVIAMDGRILKRGHDLAQVLRVLDAKLIRPID